MTWDVATAGEEATPLLPVCKTTPKRAIRSNDST
eukprot:CAMPEP_0174348152 /NCGR_PEP_ID=MMETSP0811_2-20130205/4517_1 /TAXON_ID=73025 ORGANISM="Eutreptiella gymnastica-like, Strain CCMP1594" /NCGR_SAMPLE_ID=MMETSP0811_2 /ASSEMBLY_ACC=CAM_ASM_000667 /LENGTH=33 /DNA_ID= /DNA_START= /DNA_END= /DNA_ORIENTATION=